MKKTDRHGFSMVEVLVAATLLTIIVMMLGALFQQTSTAWRVGLMRTNSYLLVRSYVGTLQRDASAMVNANLLPKELLYKESEEQNFSNSDLAFYTLSGNDETRTLNYIKYDTAGGRWQSVLKPSDGKPDWEDGERVDLLKFVTKQDENNVNMLVDVDGFEVKTPSAVEKDRDGNVVSSNTRKFPLYLTVKTRVRQSGSLYDVGAESAGPDRVWGTKDDIRTFIEDR